VTAYQHAESSRRCGRSGPRAEETFISYHMHGYRKNKIEIYDKYCGGPGVTFMSCVHVDRKVIVSSQVQMAGTLCQDKLRHGDDLC
jgi:hypothetical protein